MHVNVHAGHNYDVYRVLAFMRGRLEGGVGLVIRLKGQQSSSSKKPASTLSMKFLMTFLFRVLIFILFMSASFENGRLSFNLMTS